MKLMRTEDAVGQVLCHDITQIIKDVKKARPNFNVWCYTGYKMEDLLVRAKKEPKLKELLENIDALVDSPFILELKSYNVPFRGSSNQRIIDTRKSLSEDKVCQIPKYMV